MSISQPPSNNNVTQYDRLNRTDVYHHADPQESPGVLDSTHGFLKEKAFSGKPLLIVVGAIFILGIRLSAQGKIQAFWSALTDVSHKQSSSSSQGAQTGSNPADGGKVKDSGKT